MESLAATTGSTYAELQKIAATNASQWAALEGIRARLESQQVENGQTDNPPTVNTEAAASGRPWERIKGKKHSEMVRMWWEGHDKGEIGKQHGVVTKTVENLFCTLRKSYGNEVIPTRPERDRLLRERKSG